MHPLLSTALQLHLLRLLIVMPQSDSDKSVILVQNPDGSISEALRPGFEFPKRRLPVDSPLDSDFGDLSSDPFFLYERHESVFLALLLGALTLDSAALVSQVLNPGRIIDEFLRKLFPRSEMSVLFWTAVSVQLAFLWVFYGAGLLALHWKRPRYFAIFADIALLGVASDVVIVLVAGQGMAVLLLRSLAWLYARFLRELLILNQLLPLFSCVL